MRGGDRGGRWRRPCKEAAEGPFPPTILTTLPLIEPLIEPDAPALCSTRQERVVLGPAPPILTRFPAHFWAEVFLPAASLNPLSGFHQSSLLGEFPASQTALSRYSSPLLLLVTQMRPWPRGLSSLCIVGSLGERAHPCSRAVPAGLQNAPALEYLIQVPCLWAT